MELPLWKWWMRTFLWIGLGIGLYLAALSLQSPWSLLFPAYHRVSAADHDDLMPPDFFWGIGLMLIVLPLFAVGLTWTIAACFPFHARNAGLRAVLCGYILVLIPACLSVAACSDWKGVPAWQTFCGEAGFFLVIGLLMLIAGVWLVRLADRRDVLSKAAVSQEGVWPPAPKRDNIR